MPNVGHLAVLATLENRKISPTGFSIFFFCWNSLQEVASLDFVYTKYPQNRLVVKSPHPFPIFAKLQKSEKIKSLRSPKLRIFEFLQNSKIRKNEKSDRNKKSEITDSR